MWPAEKSRADELADLARRWLVDGQVCDWETGKPIESFRVLPGVPLQRNESTVSGSAKWQPYQIREMTGGKLQWPRTSGYKHMRFRVEADGYQAAMTPWTERGGPYTRMRVYLKPDPGIRGVLLAPNGKPIEGALIAIGMPNRVIEIQDGTIRNAKRPGKPLPSRAGDRWKLPISATTDSDGRFRLPMESDPNAMLCAVHEMGILQEPLERIRQAVLAEQPIRLQLSPWAKVKGEVSCKGTPGVGSLVICATETSLLDEPIIQSLQRTRSDEGGKFEFPNVAPGMCHVFKRFESPGQATVRPIGSTATVDFPSVGFSIEDGVSQQVIFGGPGVTIQGNLVGMAAYDGLRVSIVPSHAQVQHEIKALGANPIVEFNSLWKQFQESPEGRGYFRLNVPVAEDGSFEITDVMSGSYRLIVHGANGGDRFIVLPTDLRDFHLGRITVRENRDKLIDLGELGPQGIGEMGFGGN